MYNDNILVFINDFLNFHYWVAVFTQWATQVGRVCYSHPSSISRLELGDVFLTFKVSLTFNFVDEN